MTLYIAVVKEGMLAPYAKVPCLARMDTMVTQLIVS